MYEPMPVLLKLTSFDIRYTHAKCYISESLHLNGLPFKFREVVLFETHFQQLYSHVPPPVLASLLGQFCGRAIGAWAVSGPLDVYEKVHTLKGLETKPLECAKDTWRYQLAKSTLGNRTISLLDGDKIVLSSDNHVHCAKPSDVAKEWHILKDLFESPIEP